MLRGRHPDVVDIDRFDTEIGEPVKILASGTPVVLPGMIYRISTNVTKLA
jgi:hypothetical protein